MHSFNARFNFLDLVSFFRQLVLYTVCEKETTVKQTSTDVVLSVVCIYLLCIGIDGIDS
jgi:hypothetical protein